MVTNDDRCWEVTEIPAENTQPVWQLNYATWLLKWCTCGFQRQISQPPIKISRFVCMICFIQKCCFIIFAPVVLWGNVNLIYLVFFFFSSQAKMTTTRSAVRRSCPPALTMSCTSSRSSGRFCSPSSHPPIIGTAGPASSSQSVWSGSSPPSSVRASQAEGLLWNIKTRFTFLNKQNSMTDLLFYIRMLGFFKLYN